MWTIKCKQVASEYKLEFNKSNSKNGRKYWLKSLMLIND